MKKNDSLLSSGKIKLIKNNQKSFDVSESVSVFHVGAEGSKFKLMVETPGGLKLAQNIVVRKVNNDLILDCARTSDTKQIIIEDFFLTSLPSSSIKFGHPDDDNFIVTSHANPVKTLEDGSSLIYFYTDKNALAGPDENYLTDHFYAFDTFESDSDSGGKKAEEKESTAHADEESFGLGRAAGAILGASAAGLVGRRIYLDRQKKSNEEETDLEAISESLELSENSEYIAVEGVVALGPVIANHGLSVQVMSTHGQLLSIVDIDENGHYRVIVDKYHQQIKLLVLDETASPDYMDESTGSPKGLSSLLRTWAVIEHGKTNIAHINPLTTLAVDIASVEALKSGEQLTNEQLLNINQQVAKTFLGSEVDVTAYNIESTIDQSGYPLKGNEGGAVLAVISALEEKHDKSTDDVVSSLTDGLRMENGFLVATGAVVQQLVDGQEFLGDSFTDTGLSVIDRVRLLATPTNAVPLSASQEIYVDEDSPHTFSLNDFTFNDGNENDALQSIQLITLPKTGLIHLAGEDVVTGQIIAARDIPHLTYAPVANDSRLDYGYLVFSVSDGLVSSPEQQLQFHVRAVNDAPNTLETLIGETLEDEAFTLTESALLALVNDIDSAEVTLVGVSVEAEYGTVVKGDENSWIFTPTADLIGDALPLRVTVSDGKTEMTFTTLVKVSNTNDAPVAKADGYLPTPLIPALQSDEEQGIRVTSSPSAGFSVSPFQAFDGVQGDEAADTGRWVSSETTGWIQVDLGRGTTIYRYEMSGGENPLYAPKSWQLLGSNDGIDFTVIDTQTQVEGFASHTVQSFVLLKPVGYQFFKLAVTENQGGDYLVLDQVQFYPSTHQITLDTTEDVAASFDVLANDRDIDPDDIISLKSAVVVDEAGATLADSGAVSIVNNQLVFDASGYFDHLPEGGHTFVNVNYTVTDIAGAVTESAVYLRVNGINDTSVFGGDLTGSVTEDAAIDTTSGTLIVSDVDSGEAPIAQTTEGEYGTFTLSATGAWTYQLNNATEALERLHDDRQIQEVFAVTATDGSQSTVTVTVHGHTDNYAPTLDILVTPVIQQSWMPTQPVAGSVEGSIAAGDLLINIHDVDKGSPGMVVFQAVEGMYYSVDEGASWQDLSEASASNGILLDASAHIYAMHDLDGGNLIGFRAWDSQQGVSGTAGIDLTDPEYLGGGWAYSAVADADQTLPATMTSSPLDPPYYTAKYLFSGLNDFFAASKAGYVDTLVSADLNQDGFMDILLNDGEAALWLGQKGFDGIQETIVYHKVTMPRPASESDSHVFLDVSGDSFVDLLAVEGNLLSYYKQGADGIFDESPTSSFVIEDNYLAEMTVSDLDGDGQEEIILSPSYGVKPWMVLHIEQDGSFTHASNQFADVRDISQLMEGNWASIRDMAAGDFNGDGRIDFYTRTTIEDHIVFAQKDDGSYEKTSFMGLLHDKDGNLQDEIPQGYALTTTDLDGDGVVNDLIFAGEGIAIAYFWDDELQGFRQIDPNTPALITGVDTGSVVEEDASQLTIKAKLDVLDIDIDQSAFIVSSEMNTYGELAIDAAGFWRYRADNHQANIQALGEDIIVTDEFIIKSLDETEHLITVSVKGVNDAPTGASNRLTLDEDTTIQLSAADFSYHDIDSDPFAAVMIKALPSKGVLTLNGTAVSAGQSIAAADIGQLTFMPALHGNGNSYTSFSFKVDDGLAYSASSYKMSFDVTPVNDAPTAKDKTFTINEDTSHTFTLGDFGYHDIDKDALKSIEITALPTNGTLTFQGALATQGQVIDVLAIGHLVFTPSAHAHGDAYDSLGFTVNDGELNSVTANQITFNVVSVNDAPTAANNTLSLNEDSTYTFAAADFGYTDIDSDAFDSVLIDVLPTQGNLTLNGGAVEVGQRIAASDIDSLIFTPMPHANGTGYDQLMFTVNDGLVDSMATYHIDIDVQPVNDVPTAEDKRLSLDEDSYHTFHTADFGYHDIESMPMDSVTISVLPTNGALTLHGNEVTAEQTIDTLDLGHLIFTPVAHANGANYDSLNFTVNDGALNSAQAYQITFDVMSVNDAPTAMSQRFLLDEDSTHTFTPVDFGYNDIDLHAMSAVVIESLPVSGSLALNGSAVSAGQVITAADISNLVFTPIADENGDTYDSFLFKVNDGLVDSAPANQITFDVTPLNDAPTTVNKVLPVNEDGHYTFTMLDFGFNDVDPDTLTTVVIDTLTTNGSLQLNGSAVGAGDAISIADLGHLVFTPVANAYGTNYDSFSFQVNDGTLNSETTHQISFDVVSINDAPTASNNKITLNEDSEHVFSAGDFGYNDIDQHSLSTINIESLPINGSLSMNGNVITVGQAIDASDIANLVFAPAVNANGTAYDSFAFKVNDGLVNSAQPNTITFDVLPVNDAPSAEDFRLNVSEDGSYTFDASDFSFSDIDGDTLSSVVIDQITGSGSLTLNGTTVTAGQSIDLLAFGNLVFTTVANESGTDYANITFRVNDGTENSSMAYQLGIDVVSVNDAPTAMNKTITLDEDASYTFELTDLGYDDKDLDPIATLIIESVPITGSLLFNGSAVSAGQSIAAADVGQLVYAPLANANGDAYDSFRFKVNDGFVNSELANQITFDVTPVNDLPVSIDKTFAINEGDSHAFSVADFGFTDIDGDTLSAIVIESLPANGHLTFSGVAVTVGQSIDTLALSSLVFRPDGSDTGMNYDNFQFKVSDGNDVSASAHKMTFDVMTVNAPPTAANKSISLNEDGNYTFVAADFGYSDTDADPMHALVVESLPARGSLLLNGVAVTAGQSIGSAAIPQLVFSPLANGHGDNYSSFRFKVSDGTVNSTLANQITFDVTAVNDTPTAEDNTITFFEDGSHTFTGADFGYHDIDADTMDSLVIEALPLSGSLKLSGAAVSAGQTIDLFDVGNLVFTPAANASGASYDSFSFKVDDGAVNSASVYQMTFDIVPVNDAPTATNNSVTLAEDGIHSFTLADFGYSDTDADAFTAVSIEVLPVNGSLTLNGNAAVVGQSIAAADIPNLAFSPAAHGNGDSYDSLSFKVSDGLVNSLLTNHITFDVTPVNDVPVGNNATVMLEEEGSYHFNASDFGFSDVETADIASIIIVSLPTQGSLTLNGHAVTAGQAIDQLDLDELVFTPAENGNGATYDSFSFKVSDGTVSSDSANQITFHVVGENDAPEITEPVLDRLDFMWGGGGIVDKTADTYYFANDYVMGDSIWVSKTDGAFQKSVKIAVTDNDDGTLNVKALAAKFVDIGVWSGLTGVQKSTYFETQGFDNLLATTDMQSGYAIRDVSINSGLASLGIVGSERGRDVDYPHFHVIENAAAGTVIADLSAVDVDGDTLTYTLLDDAEGRFTIDAGTGVIRSADMSLLNYEDYQTYTVSVQVSDGIAVDVENYQVSVDHYISSNVVMHAYPLHELTENKFIYDPEGISDISITQPVYGEVRLIDEVHSFALDSDASDKEGNIAIIDGGVVVSEGSAQFDGTGMIVIAEGASAKDMLPSEAITVSSWVKVDANSGANVGLVGLIQDNGSYEQGWLLGHNGDKFYFALSSESTNDLIYLSAPSTLTIEQGRWYHVSGTYDGSEMKLFVDGAEVANNTAQAGAIAYPDDDTTVFQIGAFKDENEDRRFEGELKDVRIYDQSLIAEDMSSVMNDTALNNFYFKPLDDFDDLNINDSRDASFTYTSEKETGGSQTSHVTLTVAHNFPAYPKSIDLGNINEDTQRDITQQQLLSGATDPEGDFLRVVNVSTHNAGQGSVANNGDETFTYIPSTHFYGENVRLNYQVQEYKEVTSLDFSNGLEEGWTSVGYEVSTSGGGLGTSPDGSPILELDHAGLQDSLSYSVETRGQDTIVRLGVKGRTETDHIEVIWDGTTIQTIDPTGAWQNIEIILPATSASTSTLVLQEVASQNDSSGPLISNVSVSSAIVNLTSNSAYVDVNPVNDRPILLAPAQEQSVVYIGSNSNIQVSVLGGKTSNYTIGGSSFTHLNAKLNNVNNFGEGSVFGDLDLSVESTTTTVTQDYLDQGNLYFGGATGDSAFSTAELQLLESYVQAGSYLLTTNDHNGADPVSSYFGLPAGPTRNVSSEWQIQDVDHPLVNGDIGLGMDLRGKSVFATGNYSGFSESDLLVNDVVIARDTLNNAPTIVLRQLGSGYILFTGDEGVFRNVSSATQEFDSSDNEDVLAAAILSWALAGASSSVFDWEQGETKILTSEQMSATDVEIDNNDIVFTLSNIQHASLLGATDHGDGSYSFKQEQLTGGEISLAHDNSEIALSYDINVSDGELSSETITGYVKSFKMLDGLSGLPYKLMLNEDGNEMSLLEPSFSGNNTYYVHDRNQDNEISDKDKFSLEELAAYVNEDATINFGGKQLVLPTGDELIEAGFVDQVGGSSSAEQAFWVVDDSVEGGFALTSYLSLDDQQTEGFVVYQVIG